MTNLGTISSAHAFLNPALDAFHTFENQHCKERKPERREEECSNQSSDATGGSAVDDDADRAQRGCNGDEIQNNSGQLHYLCGDPDDNGQQYENRCE